MAKAVRPDHDAGKAVGIWIRVSTEDQVRGESPEHHERRARLYAESRAWNVKEVYHLDAISGKSVMGFLETERMLADLRRGHITGLIFSKLARLARNTKELLEFAEIFRAEQADLISLQESIDTSSPAGRLFYTMIAAMAQWEREEIAERVAASVPIRAKMGKPLGGAAPFGYRWDGRALVPDSKEAPVRKRLFELFLEHRRKKTVARLLNESGFRTRNNSLFSDTTVERLIRDPIAKGVRRANYTKSTGNKKHWVYKPEDEWVLTEVPAIVSPELWEQCNALLDERRENGKKPARRTVHLFSGLAFCVCGAKLYVPTNTGKYICRACKKKTPADDLEAVFQDQLRGFFVSPTEILAYLEQADSTVNDKRELLETMESERERLGCEMERTHRLYLDERISADGFSRTYSPLEERFKQLDDEVPKLQAELDFLRIQLASSQEVLAEARDLYSRWSDLTVEEKRHIVESIAKRITVDGSEVTIDLCWMPSSAELVATGQRNFRDSSRPRA
jgi:site-specific DNA recombinase